VSDTLPLLRGFARDDALLFDASGGIVTAGQWCAQVQALARSLPPARYAINRCEDPARFSVASAAALTAGCTLVLPHARGSEAQRALRTPFAPAAMLVDAPLADEPDAFVVPPVASDGAPAWPPAAVRSDHVAAILFTSGSTGTPAPHRKTWSMLVRGAATFAASFAPLPAHCAIVGTVAPQHMFGFETTLMAPWQTGTPLAAVRPLFPADLDALVGVLAKRGRRTWLMTTPLHLRAFHAALAAPRGLEGIVVSTMPLPAELAREVERDWHIPVREIYGCTEGGMLATRRPAADERFTAAAGLAFDLDDAGRASVHGGQLDGTLAVSDHFRRDGERLLLIGRSSELVKIAGKRTTLAALTAALHAVPGVLDGAFMLLDADAERVAALVVAPAHDATSLRAALAERIDRAFLPRPLVFVAALARDAQGKLASSAASALLEHARAPDATARPDRIMIQDAAVGGDHPCLPGHFPGRPLVPGVVLLERVERVLRAHAMEIDEVSEVKFMRAVEPEDPLRIKVEVADAARVRFAIEARGATAATGVLRWRLHARGAA